MYINQNIGKLGENIAVKYLENLKYKIIERNYSCRQGEIDIIVYDVLSKEIVFIEVKTRTNFIYGSPSESVTENKQKHIYKTAEYYVYKNKIKNVAIRFDIIEIKIDMKNKIYSINHIRNAFMKYTKNKIYKK